MQKGFDYIGVGVTFTCHDGQGRVLFAKRGKGARDEQGVWEIPGGGLHHNESAEAGMLRELKEEFCVTPLEYFCAGYHDLFRTIDGKDSHWVLIDFICRVHPEEVRIGEPEKCEAIAWHTLDNLPSPIPPGVLEMLAHIKDKLVVSL
jgi:8-oxo-dGTP diphosphatase